MKFIRDLFRKSPEARIELYREFKKKVDSRTALYHEMNLRRGSLVSAVERARSKAERTLTTDDLDAFIAANSALTAFDAAILPLLGAGPNHFTDSITRTEECRGVVTEAMLAVEQMLGEEISRINSAHLKDAERLGLEADTEVKSSLMDELRAKLEAIRQTRQQCENSSGSAWAYAQALAPYI
jgi:hypothetical protein